MTPQDDDYYELRPMGDDDDIAPTCLYCGQEMYTPHHEPYCSVDCAVRADCEDVTGGQDRDEE